MGESTGIDVWVYGDTAPLLDVLSAGLGVTTRSRAYHLLDLDLVQQTLARPPDHVSTHPESHMQRFLSDCASVPLTPTGPQMRLVIATHARASADPAVGTRRSGVVYELFVSTLPSPALTVSDILDWSLHRGSFETVLADEDEEQDADRWYSHTLVQPGVCPHLGAVGMDYPAGTGASVFPVCLRTTACAPVLEAEAPSTDESEPAGLPLPAIVYGPPQWARPSFTGGFPGSACTPQPDGTLRCPANHPGIRKNGAPSVTAPCGSCMPRASVMVAPARGSAQFCAVSRKR